VLVLCLGLALVTANGLHFLIAWELFTVAAYFLMTLERQRREVRAAGWLYLAASHVSMMCLFAFFALLAARTGSWELAAMRERVELAPLFWLALVGFGLKAGLFPLHIWLPSAHANAPSHVSAMLSGVTLKIGIYGLVRFSGWLPVPPEAGGWWRFCVPVPYGRRFALKTTSNACWPNTVSKTSASFSSDWGSPSWRWVRETRRGVGWRSRADFCMCGITGCSNHFCSSRPAQCCTQRAHAK
jgi:hypothetical protein